MDDRERCRYRHENLLQEVKVHTHFDIGAAILGRGGASYCLLEGKVEGIDECGDHALVDTRWEIEGLNGVSQYLSCNRAQKPGSRSALTC